MRRSQSATQTNGQGKPMLAYAIVNIPVRELGAFVLPVLMLGMAIVYRRQIGEEFSKLGALLKYEVPSRTATRTGRGIHGGFRHPGRDFPGHRPDTGNCQDDRRCDP